MASWCDLQESAFFSDCGATGIDGDPQPWAHELGHGLGLKHDNDGDNLMFQNRRKTDGTPAGFIRLAKMYLGEEVRLLACQLRRNPALAHRKRVARSHPLQKRNNFHYLHLSLPKAPDASCLAGAGKHSDRQVRPPTAFES